MATSEENKPAGQDVTAPAPLPASSPPVPSRPNPFGNPNLGEVVEKGLKSPETRETILREKKG